MFACEKCVRSDAKRQVQIWYNFSKTAKLQKKKERKLYQISEQDIVKNGNNSKHGIGQQIAVITRCRDTYNDKCY